MEWDVIRSAAAMGLLAVGVLFMLLGAIGVVRMPDVFNRVQVTSKTATLGLWGVFLAVALRSEDLEAVSRALAVIVLASLTVPVAAQAITRAAHRTGLPMWPADAPDELGGRTRSREASKGGRGPPEGEGGVSPPPTDTPRA